MDITGKLVTDPTIRKGFGELFAEAKGLLDNLQKDMASILPAMPGQDVAKFYDLAIGVDIHATIAPLLPTCPVPHIGMIFDIMSAIVDSISKVVPAPPPAPEDGSKPPTSLATICQSIVHGMKPSVQVHGQWIANAGAGIQHLPGIIAHVPFPLVSPMASSEIFMGSSTVLADGGPCSTKFHPVLSCNLVGVPAPMRKYKAGKKMSLMAPTSMISIMTSSGKPVLVGGPPTIDLFQLAMSLGLKGLGKIWKKTGDGLQFLIDKIKKNNPKLGKILQPIKCKLFGEPVDAATGRVYSINTDIELPGPLPFVWQRTYYSDAESRGPLGYNWHHSYNMGLYDMGNDYASLRLSDGREVIVPLLGMDESYYDRIEKHTFSHDEQGYVLIDANKLRYRFDGPKNREGYKMLSEIATLEGFNIIFRYNTQGDLKQIIDSCKKLIHVETNSKGYITRLSIESENRTISLIDYNYDENENLVYIKDIAQAEKHFYYKAHLLIQLTNQTGQSFYWEYEGHGDQAKCIHTWGDGGILEYWTEYRPGHTITRNSLGHSAHYYYDENHLIYKIVDENGGVTHQSYNLFQELELVVNPEGLSQKYQYDEWGNIVLLENENGKITEFQYDANQNLLTLTSPGGKSIEWAYDSLGRVIKKTGVDGNSLLYTYQGQYLNDVTDSQGNKFVFHFDNKHQLVQLTYPNNTFRYWQYDAMGNVRSEYDVRGNLTQYKYDDAGNITHITEADGNRHYFEYDSSYNIVYAKDNLHEVHFKYGSLGVLMSRMQNGHSINFEYDTELQLKAIHNEAGEVYRFGLDGLGHVVSEWGFDGLNRRYERDKIGRLVRVLRPDSKWSKYEYDGVGNIVLEEHSDQSWSSYKYDNDGLLIDSLNETIRVQFKRNRAGQVIKENQGKQEINRKYDQYGHVIGVESSLKASITFDYNNLGELQQMNSKGWQAQWHYDKSGLEIQRELSGQVSVKTEHDVYGRVTQRSIGAARVEQARHSYQWGKGNRLQKIVNELSKSSTDFAYDQWDNLSSGTYRDQGIVETVYKVPDAIGNLFKTPERKDREYDKGGKLLKDEKYYYHYDPEGNLLFKEFISSGQAGINNKKELQKKLDIKLQGSGVGWQYEWGGNGMLNKVILPQGSTVSFAYDPLGRRISKQHKSKVTRWLWDGNVPLHEWQYNGEFPPAIILDEQSTIKEEPEPTENVITWLFEANSFVPCGKIVGEEQYSIVSDYLGTPTHGYDSSGSLIWERELDIYGVVRKGNNDFVPFLYQGQYVDQELGLAYNRFRYYDPESGNYISQDPIGLAGNNPTLYGYVKDSNSWVDVFGLDCKISKTIHEGSQGKHIPGHNNYIAGKSILTADAQKLLDNYHAGNVSSSRVISDTKVKVDFGEVIGSTKGADGIMTETTSGIIHSGKNGAHIVPGLPDSF